MAGATAFVILGGSIAPFLAPPVVRVEQDRTDVAALTGFSSRALDETAAAVLGDLVLWRGDFDVHVSNGPIGEGVLNDAERSHMRDVRSVFTGFWALVLAGVAVLALGFRRAKSAEARAAAWRSVSGGARALAIFIAVAGAFAVFAFDAAFEVFHRLFFSAGSYTFDPATDRLVQLFPEQFWSEISVAVGIVVLIASAGSWWLARRRAPRIWVAAG